MEYVTTLYNIHVEEEDKEKLREREFFYGSLSTLPSAAVHSGGHIETRLVIWNLRLQLSICLSVIYLEEMARQP